MRDPGRIYPFCNKFAELWSKYPDLRFGQLVEIIQKRSTISLFCMEEEEFLRCMKEMEED